MVYEVIGGGVLLIFMIIGVALVFLGLPGTYFLLFGALLYDVITWSLTIGSGAIVILSILVAFGELFNLLVRITGNKLASSVIGNSGALLGSIGGAVLGISQGIFGVLIGLPVGGAVGALLFELVHYFSISKASRASLGAFFSTTMGTFMKFELSMIMLVVIVLSAVF